MKRYILSRTPVTRFKDFQTSTTVSCCSMTLFSTSFRTVTWTFSRLEWGSKPCRKRQHKIRGTNGQKQNKLMDVTEKQNTTIRRLVYTWHTISILSNKSINWSKIKRKILVQIMWNPTPSEGDQYIPRIVQTLQNTWRNKRPNYHTQRSRSILKICTRYQFQSCCFLIHKNTIKRHGERRTWYSTCPDPLGVDKVVLGEPRNFL